MVNYIKALEVIEKTAKGTAVDGISNFLLYCIYGIGFILLLIIVNEIENLFENGIIEKKKRIATLIITGLGLFGILLFVNKKHPPNYGKKEVKQIAKTFSIQHPEFLPENVEYLRTIAPAYVNTLQEKPEQVAKEETPKSDDKTDEWINEKLNEFYTENHKKTSPENKKIFENLKK